MSYTRGYLDDLAYEREKVEEARKLQAKAKAKKKPAPKKAAPKKKESS